MKIDLSQLTQQDIVVIEAIIAARYELAFTLGLNSKKLFGNEPYATLRMFDYEEETIN